MIPDGLTEIREELPLIMKMIARTARWVHPNTFKALPVWRPEAARKAPLYKKDWIAPATNNGLQKYEGNVAAQNTLMNALGVVGRRPINWTTCHIWGYDDEKYGGKSNIVQDRRFFSCVGNMILLPTPLKGFTDTVPAIKRHLRVCAFHLYGWACEHESASQEADLVRSGEIPDGYPSDWPTGTRKCLPAGTAPFTNLIRRRIADRKMQTARDLKAEGFQNYPRTEVENVLKFWKVDLTT